MPVLGEFISSYPFFAPFLRLPRSTMNFSSKAERAGRRGRRKKDFFLQVHELGKKILCYNGTKKSGLPISLEGGLCINEVGCVIVREGRRRTPRCDKLFSQRKEGSKTRI